MNAAADALSALGHAGRLQAWRLLVRAGPAGLAAGEIARRLGTPPNTLTASLAVLTRAGLARSRREGRHVYYAARFDRMADLLAFLVEDCCGGAPEVCGPVAAVAARRQGCV